MELKFETPSAGFTYNGKHYSVAERTLDVCQRLQETEIKMRTADEAEYKIKLKQLDILIGADAVKELFGRKGKKLNLDFLDAIYVAAFSEFTGYSRKMKSLLDGTDAEKNKTNEELEKIAGLLKSLLEVNDKVMDAPRIRRDG